MLRTVNMRKNCSRANHAVTVMTKNEREIQNAADNMIARYGQDALREVDLRILELESRNQPQAVQLWRSIRKRIALVMIDAAGDTEH